MFLYIITAYLIIGAIHHYIFYTIDVKLGVADKISSSFRLGCALSWIFVDILLAISLLLYIGRKKK